MPTPNHYGIAGPVIDAGLVKLGYGSQAELARRLGIAPTSITRWRDGTTTPRREHWPAIEEFLGILPGTIAKLVDG
jgi:DNA-binding transcriptional regulator YdaS (Cro superfamily)